MSTDKKIFDDLARMAGGAVNVMSGLQQQVRDDVRSRFEDFTGRLDLIARHEFDDLHALVAKLHAKIAELEKIGGQKAATAKRHAKPVVKKATKAKADVKRKAIVKVKAVKKSMGKSKSSVKKSAKKAR